MKNYNELLKQNNQEHLLKFLANATESQKELLLADIEKIDFDQLNNLYKISKRNNEKAIDSIIIEHIKFVDKYKIESDEFENLKKIGEDVIKSENYAVVTMAGGQGTRLGHDGPKGTFKLNISPRPMYLFEILAENLKKANEKYNINLQWYIMTSSENNEKTVEFFEENNYFEYDKNSIKFFKQGNLPLLDENGKLLIDENYRIKMAADGNGCIYKAMSNSGILDDMKKKNIKWVFIGSVDNALLNMVDPILLGLTIKDGNKIGSKSVVKNNPHEKVGVFCKKNGKPAVIEYSELPEAMAEETDSDGELIFGESHIMCNLYSFEALKLIGKQNLPYHSAHKKANYMDQNGNMIIANEPNAYKYEAFIFDGFNYFENISILRGKRDEDFAPVKNKVGDSSPETATKLYNDYWSKNK